MKIKNIVVAYKAQASQEMPGVIDIFGSFDNIIQPYFPFGLPSLSIVLTFENLQRPTLFEVRLNGPDDALITKGEFGVLPDPFGIGKKVIDLEQFLVAERGKYTLDIFEKVAEDKVKFLSTEDVFMADYPPERRMSDEEKQAILNTEGVIKTVRTEFTGKPDGEVLKLQVNLDKTLPLDEGYIGIPDSGIVEVDGEKHDLTGIRRQIEWMFGNPLPKENQEETATQQEEGKDTEEK